MFVCRKIIEEEKNKKRKSKLKLNRLSKTNIKERKRDAKRLSFLSFSRLWIMQ